MNHWQHPSRIDRLDELRADPAALDDLAAHPDARLLTLGKRLAIPVKAGQLWCDPFDSPRRNEDLLLGRVGELIWWARQGDAAHQDLRYLDLPEEQAQLAMMATALFEWHETTPRCPKCAITTVPARAGAIRQCLRCGCEVFPRTDPAVIVAVTDPQDRLLLTHNASWAPGRVSIQAGFIEAGESAEQACYREIAEETGLVIRSLRFACSQPWPFPRSLMLGFEASVDGTQVRVDGTELTWGRFFTREEFHAALIGGEISLPGPISLARQLIRAWENRG